MALPIQFLPMLPGEYKCHIVFLDASQGEFMHEVVATALLPAPQDPIKWRPMPAEKLTKLVPLFFLNPKFAHVAEVTMARMSTVTGKHKELKKAREAEWNSQKFNGTQYLPSTVAYKVQCDSPFFSFVPYAVLQDSSSKDLSQMEMDHTVNHLLVQFSPRGPGLYKSDVVLTSNYDVRLLHIEAKVMDDKGAPTVEFHVPARQTVTQPLPIVNGTDERWSLRVNWSSTKSQAGSPNDSGPDEQAAKSGSYSVRELFQHPMEFSVAPHSTEHFPLSFSPPWLCSIKSTLELINGKTDEKFSFDIIGVGEEPVPEEKLQMECAARTEADRLLVVKNYENSDVEYRVETDLPNISGEPTLRVKRGGTAEYALQLRPQLSGVYRGTITFHSSVSGRFLWYAVELTATRPKPEQTLSVQATVRRAAKIVIPVGPNTTDSPLEFFVNLVGSGLLGARSHTLPPHSVAPYELVFAPLEEGEESGSISFSHPLAGEYWYKLDLSATKPEPVVVPKMECPLGQRRFAKFSIENPLNEELQLQAQSSNPRSFSAIPSTLKLPAQGSAFLTLVYTPSAFNLLQSGQIRLAHPRAGEWLYMLEGEGKQPENEAPILVSCAVNARSTAMVNFKNPFASTITLAVAVDSTGDLCKAFSFLNGKAPTELVVPAFGSAQLPLLFAPPLIGAHTLCITLTTAAPATSTPPSARITPIPEPAGEEAQKPLKMGSAPALIKWTYLVKGIAEGPTWPTVQEIRCAARDRFDETLTVSLMGLPPSPLTQVEQLSVSIEVEGAARSSTSTAATSTPAAPDSAAFTSASEGQLSAATQAANELDALLQRCLTAELLTSSIQHGSSPVQVRLRFAPLKPFKAKATMVIRRESDGGRWRFPLLFVSTEAPIDDTIVIEGSIRTSTKVAFNLCAPGTEAVPFTATFTHDSASEFNVSPASGLLQPALLQQQSDDDGRPSGTQLIVSFSPREYGKTLQGKVTASLVFYVLCFIPTHLFLFRCGFKDNF